MKRTVQNGKNLHNAEICNSMQLINWAIDGTFPKDELIKMAKNRESEFSPDEVAVIYELFHEL